MTEYLRHLRADLRELQTSRTWRWTAVAVMTLGVALTSALVGASGNDGIGDVTTAAGQGESIIDPLTGLVLGVLAAAYWGSQHRDGALVWSFVAGRSRLAVLAAALASTVVVSVLLAALVTAIKIGSLALLVGPAGTEFMVFSDERGVTATWGALVAAVFLAALGTACGFVARHGAMAVGALLGWLLVIEPVIASLLPRRFVVYFPGQAMAAIRNAVADVDQTTALSVMLVALTVVVVTAGALAVRRDPA